MQLLQSITRGRIKLNATARCSVSQEIKQKGRVCTIRCGNLEATRLRLSHLSADHLRRMNGLTLCLNYDETRSSKGNLTKKRCSYA
jgi:hypothetical protein